MSSEDRSHAEPAGGGSPAASTDAATPPPMEAVGASGDGDALPDPDPADPDPTASASGFGGEPDFDEPASDVDLTAEAVIAEPPADKPSEPPVEEKEPRAKGSKGEEPRADEAEAGEAGPPIGPYRIREVVATEPHGELLRLVDAKGSHLVGRAVPIEGEPGRQLGTRLGELHRTLVRVADAHVARSMALAVVDEPREAILFVWEDPHGTSLRESPELEARLAVRLIADVARALAEVHALGVCHLGIAPERIEVTPGGIAKLVEAGVAQVVTAAGGDPIEALLAGPAGIYAAPELREPDRAPSVTADVFALGAVLLERLAGARLDEEGSAWCAAREAGQVPPPGEVAADLDEALARVLARALAASPAERYEDPEQLARALESWLGADPLAAWFPEVDEKVILKAPPPAAVARRLDVPIGAIGLGPPRGAKVEIPSFLRDGATVKGKKRSRGEKAQKSAPPPIPPGPGAIDPTRERIERLPPIVFVLVAVIALLLGVVVVLSAMLFSRPPPA